MTKTNTDFERDAEPPSETPCEAEGAGNSLVRASLPDLAARLREQIVEAQSLLESGDVRGAEALGKATLQLIRAVEAQIKLEASQSSHEPGGVTYDAADVARARAELRRRFDRLAKTLRPDEMAGGAE